MTNIRNWINLVENIDKEREFYINQAKEREFYINQAKEFRKERAKWWPVSSALMASYKDGSHTVKSPDGTLTWYKNGKIHRDGDKPAHIAADGTLGWFKNGVYYRGGDKPAWIGATGILLWYKNDLWHRDGDRPAVIEPDGSLKWVKNGLLHRLAGPASITKNNNFEWYFNGEQIRVESQEEFLKRLSDKGHIDVYRLKKS